MSQFVKVPKQLFSIRPSDARMYAVFLDFKAFNPEGLIKPPFKVRVNRSFYKYWQNKLIARGWALKEKEGICLASYQSVWRSLGVNQSWHRGIRRYRFAYWKVNIDDLPLERKDYVDKLMNIVLNQVAGNKVRQIKWRLNNRQIPSRDKKETFMSCRSVAKLFGLTSSASGYKYRQRLFNVIEEPTLRIHTLRGSRYKCKKIAL